MKIKRRWLAFLLVGLLVLGVSMTPALATNTESEYINPEQVDDERAVATGDKGMVVTAHPLASEVGAQVLENGGNAVDAAVAIHYALNVAEPMMSGIGGGGFLMYYHAEEDDVTIIDSRERAPAGATPDMFLDDSQTVTDPGKLIFSAIEQDYQEDKQFHLGEMHVRNLDNDETIFSHQFEGESGDSWDEEKFDTLFERGTTLEITEEGGKLTFGPPHGSNLHPLPGSFHRLRRQKIANC